MKKEWIQEKKAEYSKTLQEIGCKILAFLKECPYYSKEEREAYIKEVEYAMNGELPSELVPCFDTKFYFSFSGAEETEGMDHGMSTKSKETLKEWMKWMKRKEGLGLSRFQRAMVDKAYIDRYEDSNPIEFSGDIVITDPCYLIRKRDFDDAMNDEPKEEDFLSYPKITDYPDYVEIIPGLGIYNSMQYTDEMGNYDKACTAYMAQTDDWVKCKYGDRMDLLGIHKCMVRSTLYGDWSCSVFMEEDKYGHREEIGNFCADAGLVIVADMAEVLAYNPDFQKWAEEHPWCATIINGFEGTVQFVVNKYTYDEDGNVKDAIEDDDSGDYEVEVIGKGTYINSSGERADCNFIGMQTGL